MSSNRNLTDSALTISQNIEENGPTKAKKTPCDKWKVVSGISIGLSLVLMAIIIYLLVRQRNTPCETEIEVHIPGTDTKYVMVKLDKRFDEAQKYCRSVDSHLSSFASMKEWTDFADPLFFLASADDWTKPVWLGARGNGNDSFAWADGTTPFRFNTTQRSGVAPWYAVNTQPDNGFDEAICIYALVGKGRTPEHSWLDYNCPTKMWFVCEKIQAQ